MAKNIGQRNLIVFSGLCASMAAGLLCLEFQGGERSFEGHPSNNGKILTLEAKTVEGSSRFPDLRIAGERLSLGKEGEISFSTDASGAAAIPMTVGTTGVPKGTAFPMAFSWQLDAKDIAWNQEDAKPLILQGLRPDSRYSMNVALWAVDGKNNVLTQESMDQISDCRAGCVAAFGVPRLAHTDSGPLWRRAELNGVAELPWPAPIMFAVGLALWRLGGRGAARKLGAALGVESGVAMPVRGPKTK